jgi:DNA helicase II / ATP-dependent DNA helicase PcrA
MTVMPGCIEPGELAAALGSPPPTAEQADVIAADPGKPTLVVAGAGSGKTETMAARVVWLVANGYVTPEEVLGLTFTRKAAQQLAERVRARLRRLAGSPLLDRPDPTGQRRAAVLAGEATVLTYHAYAGRLVAEHALRLPADPGARLLTETGAWQLAHRVTAGWEPDLDLDGKVPHTVTGWLLALAGQLAEHLDEPAQLRQYTEEMITTLVTAGPGPHPRSPLRADLKRVLDAQRSRLAMLPLVERYIELKRREAVLDFGDQMSVAAALARDHPEVGQAQRARFRAVLLDEYQDTGHSQRVLLRSLFGNAAIPVTAVGDPCQSIYGWRGASAANLPRFTTDFPHLEGTPALTRGLLTSFRNPPEVLAVANAVSGKLRGEGVRVGELCCRDGAESGEVRCALLSDVRTEVDWVVDAIDKRWHSAIADRGAPPSAAVLVRRRADMAAMAAALRARGVPVEVVGLGGLLDTPEVRDLVSVLRLLVDPLAGTAAARLLTGARWRIGAADLAALWDRARELSIDHQALSNPGSSGRRSTAAEVLAALPGELPGEATEGAGLVDALDSPGEPRRYSELGFRRLRALAAELRALRGRITQPLTDLVADAERTLLLDTESLVRPGSTGRAHLDAFADVVADFAAASPLAGLPALLDYLATAEETEDGFELGEVEVAHDRVQILTVHAAKGLEWQVVAVPHLVGGVFPAAKKSSSWLRTVTELPVALRGDQADLPALTLPAGADQKELAEAFAAHEAAFDGRRLTEERRLLYVAVTRAEQTLLVSGHYWGAAGSTPRLPSEFLLEISQVKCCVIDEWACIPGEGEPNPLDTAPRQVLWPVDPLGLRRDAVAEGAQLVRDALASDHSPASHAEGWQREIDVLLAERDARRAQQRVMLPAHVSVSQLVELADDPSALAARLRRPLPLPPNPMARRGTAFHAWLERRFGSTRLIDHDELPGAADASAAPNSELESLQAAFLASEWAARTPYDVEVPFETVLDGVGVRGRMDAVFADPDGGWTVVDWKTGEVPEEIPHAVNVQLAAYRLAWSALSGAPLDCVRTAFHYVRTNRTVRAADLLDAEGLRDLLRRIPTG